MLEETPVRTPVHHGPYRPSFLDKKPPSTPLIPENETEGEAKEKPVYTRADVLAESAGRGINPDICSLGTGLRVKRHFA